VDTGDCGGGDGGEEMILRGRIIEIAHREDNHAMFTVFFFNWDFALDFPLLDESLKLSDLVEAEIRAQEQK
jgi:hypothetical protein